MTKKWHVTFGLTPSPCVIWWHCRDPPLECHVLFEWPLTEQRRLSYQKRHQSLCNDFHPNRKRLEPEKKWKQCSHGVVIFSGPRSTFNWAPNFVILLSYATILYNILMIQHQNHMWNMWKWTKNYHNFVEWGLQASYRKNPCSLGRGNSNSLWPLIMFYDPKYVPLHKRKQWDILLPFSYLQLWWH